MGMKIISGQAAKNVCVYVCLGVVDFHHEWIATPYTMPLHHSHATRLFSYASQEWVATVGMFQPLGRLWHDRRSLTSWNMRLESRSLFNS